MADGTKGQDGLMSEDGVLIHIHEDDWGMRELHPVAASAEAVALMEDERRASAANRSPDGLGWTELHVIESPEVGFADAGLTVERAVEILGAHLPKVQRFVATATAGLEEGVHDPLGVYDDDPICFGFDADAFVKVDVRDGGIAAIWFDLTHDGVAHASAMRQAFVDLDAEAPSVIADHHVDVIGAVRDASFLDGYFAALTSEPTRPVPGVGRPTGRGCLIARLLRR